MKPGAIFYRLALSLAKDGNLTGAYKYAAVSLSFNQNENARRLYQICAHELGLTNNFPDLPAINLSNPFTRFKTVRTLKSSYQSVRVLNILGCLYAISGKTKKSTLFFAHALAKDRGNTLAAAALQGVCQIY